MIHHISAVTLAVNDKARSLKILPDARTLAAVRRWASSIQQPKSRRGLCEPGVEPGGTNTGGGVELFFE